MQPGCGVISRRHAAGAVGEIYLGDGANADQVAQQAQDFWELFVHGAMMPHELNKTDGLSFTHL